MKAKFFLTAVVTARLELSFTALCTTTLELVDQMRHAQLLEFAAYIAVFVGFVLYYVYVEKLTVVSSILFVVLTIATVGMAKM
jgi:uncharacterized membrane protein